jgi:hypothetical protein
MSAMKATRTVVTALDDVDVECTHCGIKMSTSLVSGSLVRYFRCASCHRWVTSCYTEVFQADAKVRRHPKALDTEPQPSFDGVKHRLERWLAALDDQDPYRMLGVSPLDSPEAIRDRYRALALENHPDRGGSPDRMRDLNLAYERIVDHRERRQREALGAGRKEQQLSVG